MTGRAVEAVTVGHADGRDLVDIPLFEALAPVARDLNIHVSTATPMLTSARPGLAELVQLPTYAPDLKPAEGVMGKDEERSRQRRSQ